VSTDGQADAGSRPSATRDPAGVTFVMVLHSHQPVGNLDFAVRYATDVAYRPLLEVLADYPELKCCLHYSGSLLEWFEANAPEMMEGIGQLVERGQVELIGGAFYDPILTMLPEADRHGQITSFREYLTRTFGQTPRGAWLAERVWEQPLTRSLVDAGVGYITLDDSHFLHAGLTLAELVGGFLTEDDGRLLRVDPASEVLRYRIPFQDPERTIELLSQHADADAPRVVVYADDGEKFGSWPETYTHVYENGWLRRFIELLLENRDWIHIATLGEAFDRLPPVGTVYLPDGSYREMTEWALPAPRLADYEDLVNQLKDEGRYETIKPLLKMGTWRNFKAKYREANLLYAKSLHVSRKVNELLDKPAGTPARAHLLAHARQELYRGQCNCPYWHGVFGGLYLPHLRSSAYSRLISAEAISDRLRHRGASWVEAEEVDFDLDGRPELLLSSAQVALGLVPHRGGHLFELDLRSADPEGETPGICFNLTNSLTRRWEAYHRTLSHSEGNQDGDGDEVKTIHEIVAVKTPGLRGKLRYDTYERESLVDHCLPADVGVAALEGLQYEELGDFVEAPYLVKDRRVSKKEARVLLARRGRLRAGADCPLLVQKEVVLPRRRTEVVVGYRLQNLSDERLHFRFAVEWNFSLLAGNAPDRYYFLPGAPVDRANLGPLASSKSLPPGERLGLRDEWLGCELVLRAGGADGWFLLPIESVSQSEGGLELVYQSSCVMPHWLIDLPPGGQRRLGLALAVGLLAS